MSLFILSRTAIKIWENSTIISTSSKFNYKYQLLSNKNIWIIRTGLFLDNVTVLNDFKQVVMVAKIHYYILTAKINEHKRMYIEKRTNQVLNLINKSCTDAICRDYIADIIYISSLFIPYLNKPDFLFTKIIKNIVII